MSNIIYIALKWFFLQKRQNIYQCLPYYTCKLYIQVNWNKYTSTEKKLSYLIKYQAIKHGVSRMWFIQADIKDFKSDLLRTIQI